MKNYNLTIAIPSYNEEKHIRECIEAIGKDFADNIFVIDSFSSDQTISIAESLGAKIIQFKWNGKYQKVYLPESFKQKATSDLSFNW